MQLGLVFADDLSAGQTLYDREVELLIEQVDRRSAGIVGVSGKDLAGKKRYLVFRITETVWRGDPSR